MTRAQVFRRAASPAVALAAVLALSACGGDDDDTTSSTPAPGTTAPVVNTIASSTTAPPVATQPPATPTTMPELITEGATVVVANASSVNGAAGRMSDELAAAGFTLATATNSSEKVATTKVYYNASVPEAEAVANSVVAALGGGDIVLEPLPTPAPLEDPDAIGEATVLVALGEDTADKTLAQLQGGGAATEGTTADSAPGSSAPPTSAG